jgi:hypothetical protein
METFVGGARTTQGGDQRMNLGRYRDLAASRVMANRPTAETTATLRDELLFQRATQTYL